MPISKETRKQCVQRIMSVDADYLFALKKAEHYYTEAPNECACCNEPKAQQVRWYTWFIDDEGFTDQGTTNAFCRPCAVEIALRLSGIPDEESI